MAIRYWNLGDDYSTCICPRCRHENKVPDAEGGCEDNTDRYGLDRSKGEFSLYMWVKRRTEDVLCEQCGHVLIKAEVVDDNAS